MKRANPVFVHLIGPEGDIFDRDDAPPGAPCFPASVQLQALDATGAPLGDALPLPLASLSGHES